MPQWRPSLEGAAFATRGTINISPFYGQETVVKKTRSCVQGHIEQNCSCLGLSTSRSPKSREERWGKSSIKLCFHKPRRSHQTPGLPSKPFSLQRKLGSLPPAHLPPLTAPPRVLAEFSSTFLAAPSSRLPRGRSFRSSCCSPQALAADSQLRGPGAQTPSLAERTRFLFFL